MNLEKSLSLVLEVNEKFEKSDKEKTAEIYFDVLHATLFEIINGCTEEQFNSIPAPYRVTIEKLEKEIFEFCSTNYQTIYDEYVKDEGVFYKKPKEKVEDKPKIITKCKQTIGFIVEADEGLNI